MFPKEFCLSVVRKPQSAVYEEGFIVCVKALVCGAAAVLVIFHILLLRCVWFGETGSF